MKEWSGIGGICRTKSSKKINKYKRHSSFSPIWEYQSIKSFFCVGVSFPTFEAEISLFLPPMCWHAGKVEAVNCFWPLHPPPLSPGCSDNRVSQISKWDILCISPLSPQTCTKQKKSLFRSPLTPPFPWHCAIILPLSASSIAATIFFPLPRLHSF